MNMEVIDRDGSVIPKFGKKKVGNGNSNHQNAVEPRKIGKKSQ